MLVKFTMINLKKFLHLIENIFWLIVRMQISSLKIHID